ncbi:MAG: hypothetical protein FH758_10255 [Firmicutes bacterium]|nr:hypothetical protein [Bacillota bacterium]
MSYDKGFNNPLAIWTAFGGRGNLKRLFEIPSLNWQKLYYYDFGYSSYNSERQISVYDNGQAQIAVYYAKTPYMSYFDKTTGQWTIADVPWWSYGEPQILWAGDGVFLAKITGFSNIIASFDGITWHNGGYCENAQNAMTVGAYDAGAGCGIVSFWYYKSPLYYSYDSLTERTAWVLVGSDGSSVPVFSSLTAHKGLFVGITSSDTEIAKANPSSPGVWTITIPEDQDETSYIYLKSVHEKLFVMKWRYIDGTFHVNLCVINDDATQVTETNLSYVGDLDSNNTPNPQNIIWMESWGKYALFNEGMLYVSEDGLTWEGVEQSGLTSNQSFGGAIYVPDDGFYVKGNNCVHYAPY